MDRRTFVGMLTGGVLAAPLAAEAQHFNPLFVFNQRGDCLAAKLRPGNVPVRAGGRRCSCPSLMVTRIGNRASSFAPTQPLRFPRSARRWSSVAWRTPFDSRPIKCWSGPSRISSPGRGAGPVTLRWCATGACTIRPPRGPLPARDREGRASSRRVIPAGRLHRDHPDRTNRAVVHFYNGRGTAEQWIKEGKAATHWTRLSCHRFRANEVRLLLGVIAYNLGNLLRRLTLPLAIQNWSLTSLQQRVFKTGGRLIRHAPVLHPAACRKLLDGTPLSADSRPHRAACVASA